MFGFAPKINGRVLSYMNPCQYFQVSTVVFTRKYCTFFGEKL